MTTENATGVVTRLNQAVLAHLQHRLWNDSRNGHILAWMVARLLRSQQAALPFWTP
ncbi:hypothetical protein [Deinococcus sp. RM]|uniref:hypothetical protein n=1 Tax=Deinococcus sp. RM TaxID=2316359 RepID=UPI003AB6733F